jgi:hypothetical protein
VRDLLGLEALPGDFVSQLSQGDALAPGSRQEHVRSVGADTTGCAGAEDVRFRSQEENPTLSPLSRAGLRSSHVAQAALCLSMRIRWAVFLTLDGKNEIDSRENRDSAVACRDRDG